MEIKPLSISEQLRAVQNIDGINSIDKQGIKGVAQPEKHSFAEFFKEKLSEVNQLGLDADRRIQDAVTGKESNPHSTLIAIQKADISFRLLMSVKERIVQAYQQVIRTPIG